MQVSISTGHTDFQPKAIANIAELLELKQEKNIAPAVFKDDHRRRENFLSADFVGFDIDGTLDLDVCVDRLISNELEYCLIPSRSHKDGTPKRYHVFLPLEDRVVDVAVYEQTVRDLLKLFPEADEKCKDAARLFYASGKQKEKYVGAGRSFPVSKGRVERVEPIAEGGRNDTLFKAAVQLAKNGIGYDEVLDFLMVRNERCSPPLPYHEIVNIARSCTGYTDEPARLELSKISEVYETKYDLDWTVDELFIQGGLTILGGQQKKGKSTLTRQLCKAVLDGGKFLDRQCKKGPVIYLALEEHMAILKDQYKQLGISPDAPLYIASDLPAQGSLQAIEDAIVELKPALVVVDTLILGVAVDDINEYKGVSEKLKEFRNLARRNDTHILMVHHISKNQDQMGSNKLMGSAGLGGAADCIMVLEVGGGTDRRITSEQRGGRSFDNQRLLYDNGLYIINRVDTSMVEF